MERVYVGVGSNLAPRRNVRAAFERVRGVIRLDRVARCYWSDPVGRPEQPPYLNTVWSGLYDGTPHALRQGLREIEAALGRRRTADRYASRTVDLDVLLFGDRVIRDGELTVPDPDLRTRRFVARPLLEVAPRLRLPDTGEALRDVVAALGPGALELDAELSAELAQALEA